MLIAYSEVESVCDDDCDGIVAREVSNLDRVGEFGRPRTEGRAIVLSTEGRVVWRGNDRTSGVCVGRSYCERGKSR